MRELRLHLLRLTILLLPYNFYMCVNSGPRLSYVVGSGSTTHECLPVET